jgi:hypothetical protein
MCLKSLLDKTFLPVGKQSPTQCVLNIQCSVCSHSSVLKFARLWNDLIQMPFFFWKTSLEFWSVRIMLMCQWTILQKTTAYNLVATFV